MKFKGTVGLAILMILAACSTTKNKPSDPAGVERTSDYCVLVDREAQFYACNTGLASCISIRGGLICSPNPAPSAAPSPTPVITAPFKKAK